MDGTVTRQVGKDVTIGVQGGYASGSFEILGVGPHQRRRHQQLLRRRPHRVPQLAALRGARLHDPPRGQQRPQQPPRGKVDAPERLQPGTSSTARPSTSGSSRPAPTSTTTCTSASTTGSSTSSGRTRPRTRPRTTPASSSTTRSSSAGTSRSCWRLPRRLRRPVPAGHRAVAARLRSSHHLERPVHRSARSSARRSRGTPTFLEAYVGLPIQLPRRGRRRCTAPASGLDQPDFKLKPEQVFTTEVGYLNSQERLRHGRHGVLLQPRQQPQRHRADAARDGRRPRQPKRPHDRPADRPLDALPRRVRQPVPDVQRLRGRARRPRVPGRRPRLLREHDADGRRAGLLPVHRRAALAHRDRLRARAP